MDRRASSASAARYWDLAAGLTICLLFAAPYFGLVGFSNEPWRYVVCDGAILVALAGRLGILSWKAAGLAMSYRNIVLSLATFVLGRWIATAAITTIEQGVGLEVVGSHAAFSLSQVLHQEIVLRALLLGVVLRCVMSRHARAGVAALTFSSVHVFYIWWRGMDAVSLEAAASVALFAYSTNLVFLRTKHIGYTLAIHGAWNVSRFGNAYRLGEVPISETQSFQYIEGDTIVVWGTLVLAVLTIALDRRFSLCTSSAESLSTAPRD